MVQNSNFWPDNGIGDAKTYSLNDWSDLWGILFTTDRTVEGVLRFQPNGIGSSTVDSELFPWVTGGTNLNIAAGAALVDGKLYTTDGGIIGGGRPINDTGQIILRKTTAAGTIRMLDVAVGALTQTAAVWEIFIATWTTDGGGIVTVTDARIFAQTPLDRVRIGSGTIDKLDEINGDGIITSFLFSAIPSTYDHLMLMGYVRTDSGGARATSSISLRFNADAAANYLAHIIIGNVTSGFTSSYPLGNELQVGVCSRDDSDRYSPIKILIPYYADANYYKTVLSDNTTVLNAAPTGTQYSIYRGFGTWLNAAVINSIEMINGSGFTFETNSKLTLYGIKS